MFGNWFKKEAPFQGFMGFGGGATNLFYGAGVSGPGVNYFGGMRMMVLLIVLVPLP